VKLVAAAALAILVLIVAGAAATAFLAAWIEARYPPRGRFVEVAGGRLHVVEAGPSDREPAATILLLHGASGSSGDPMLALGEPLARRFRVIAPDRPGSGWSDRIAGAAAASPARQAAILREALDRLGVGKAVVVGHSWSGALATNLALDHRDRVAGLVLISPVTHPWPGGSISWYYGAVNRPWLGRLLTRVLTTPAGLLLTGPTTAAVFAPQAPPAGYIERAAIPLVLRPSTFEANAADVAALYGFVTAQSRRYGDIAVPTTIVSGDADAIVWTHLHSRALEREIPGARLVVLPGVGHMPHHAAPDLVVREIEALAARAGPGTAAAQTPR
jgi:pimeloyl-ACP methyl ester carboxylesterase